MQPRTSHGRHLRLPSSIYQMSVKHADIFNFFSKILPNEELLYHSPLPPNRPYDPSTTRFIASRLILSLTPSEAVYNTLHQDPKVRSILFLHRPFRLDRRRIPHGTLVLSSHVRYDELLTTGWNEALADEHSVVPGLTSGTTAVSARQCIQGYKDNPDRRIGLVGLLESPQAMQGYADRLSTAFGGHENVHVSNNTQDNQVKALACLNAFTPEVLERVLDSARGLGVAPEEVLCLTGAVREVGMQVAKEQGMSVLAVGHRRCEMWGLKYFEREARKMFPHIKIVLHEEEEEPRPTGTRNGGAPRAPAESRKRDQHYRQEGGSERQM